VIARTRTNQTNMIGNVTEEEQTAPDASSAPDAHGGEASDVNTELERVAQEISGQCAQIYAATLVGGLFLAFFATLAFVSFWETRRLMLGAIVALPAFMLSLGVLRVTFIRPFLRRWRRQLDTIDPSVDSWRSAFARGGDVRYLDTILRIASSPS